MGAMGSQFHTEGPPPRTMASSSARSSALTGMRERSRASMMLVQAISKAMVKPTTSKEAMGEEVSSESMGTPFLRMRSAMSGQGR